MEIVGSDISAMAQDGNLTPTGSVVSMEGSPGDTDSNSQVQSLSELAIIENMADLLKDIEKCDLVLADNVGWLHHLQSGQDRWCVIADIIMCVFENQDTNKPLLSILLPGADIFNAKEILGNKVHVARNRNTLKFGITIDSNIAGQEHTFFAQNEDDYTKWMHALKMASEFDQEDSNSQTELSVNSDCPSTSNLSRLSPSDSYNFNPMSTNETGIELEMSLGSPDSLDSPVNFSQQNHRHLDLHHSCSDLSLQSESSTTSKESGISMLDSMDFKKILRGEIRENGHSSPIHTSSSTQDIFLSPPKSMSLDRRYFKSMDHLDQLILGKTMLNPSVSNQEIHRNQNLSAKATTQGVTHRKSQSLRRPLSQSLDLSKISPAASGLVRKASGFKERMFGKRGKSLQNVTLGSLAEVKMSGFLQHKVLLKWQKLFCAVSKGSFYAFKTKEDSSSPEFIAILSNYTITYLLNDRQKKPKSSKQFVFKLTQPSRKSIYLCAAHSLDLAKWIQVLQMEANKVNVDNPDTCSFDSDSWATPSLFPNTNAKYPLGSSQDDLNHSHFFQDGFQASEKLSSSCVSETLEVVSTDQGRVTVSHHASQQNDSEIIAAWDTSSSCSTIYTSTLDSNSTADIDTAPRHDDALKKVWETDNYYRFSAVRKHAQRLKKSFSDRKKDSPSKVTCKIIIDDMSEESPLKCDDDEDIQREVTEHKLPKKKTTDCSVAPGIRGGEHSPTAPKRHKPLSVRPLSVRQLGNPDFNGYLERRHQDGTWIRYWFCVKSGWLYCYLTPSDLLTVDVLELKQFSVSCRLEKFPAKPYVIEISQRRFFSLYLAADDERSMTEWTNQLQSGILIKETKPPPPPPSPEEVMEISSGILSDDSSVPDEASDLVDGDICASGTSNAALSDARQNLLEQVLKLKHDLERKKSETEKKRGLIHASKSVPAGLDKKVQDEKLVHEITSLRQRRLSTQLKVDTLQKQMDFHHIRTSKKKPLFRFGGRQKSPTESLSNNNPFMEEQVRELTDRLQVIDKDLTHRENKRSLNTRWLDLANNNPDTESGLGARMSPGPEVQRRSHLFPVKGQSDARRSQSLKLHTSKSLEVLCHSDSASSTNQTPESSIDSITPPTESISPSDNVYSLAKLNKGKNWFWRRKSEKDSSKPPQSSDSVQATNQITLGFDVTDSPAESPRISPRREINPQVLADIQEFEELSKLALRNAQDSDLRKKVLNTS